MSDPCPITLREIKVPFELSCNHTFEKSAIAQWLDKNPICPICRRSIGVKNTLQLRVFTLLHYDSKSDLLPLTLFLGSAVFLSFYNTTALVVLISKEIFGVVASTSAHLMLDKSQLLRLGNAALSIGITLLTLGAVLDSQLLKYAAIDFSDLGVALFLLSTVKLNIESLTIGFFSALCYSPFFLFGRIS